MLRFTARMPLLTATSAFGLGRDARVLFNSVIYTVTVPYCVESNRRQIVAHVCILRVL